jgi:ankyrin repeat protein
MAISELLKYKPNLNTKGAYGWTALHYAARENNQVLIKDLLYAGADPSIKDNWGRTPIKITKERNFKEAKKLFKN